MKAQTPAEGISLVKDFGDSKHYKVDCTCGNEDDAIRVWIALEEDMEELRIEFDVMHKTEWWKKLAEWETYKIKNSWLYAIVNTAQELINGIHHRLVVTKDVWVHGYVKYYSCTYMSKQQALNLSQTLVDAIADIEEKKK
jgi:hypothetical protein